MSPRLDRSLPPPPGPARPFHFPSFHRQTLPLGLTVYAARSARVPLYNLELIARAGAGQEPPGTAGIATLTAGLLDEGSERAGNALDIARRVEQLGGSLSTAADWEVASVSINALSPDLARGLELAVDLFSRATLPEEELERLRRLRLNELLRRRHSPGTVADERLHAALYRGMPYATPLAGTEESVLRLDRETVAAFYRRHYTLADATLIAVGDLDPEAFVAEAAVALAGLPAGAPAPPPSYPLTPLAGVEIHLIDRPGAAQTELRMGHPGPPRVDPDFSRLTVLNMLFGGKFTSRINLNLRERHGYTYGVTSRFAARRGPGPFTIGAAVANESAGAAAREVFGEIRRLQQELVEPGELTETQSYMLGVFSFNMQSGADLAQRLESLAVFDLPDDHFDRYPERILAATREDLMAVARRHLHPERMAVVAVGPAEQLAPQFEGMGEVTIHPAEPEG